MQSSSIISSDIYDHESDLSHLTSSPIPTGQPIHYQPISSTHINSSLSIPEHRRLSSDDSNPPPLPSLLESVLSKSEIANLTSVLLGKVPSDVTPSPLEIRSIRDFGTGFLFGRQGSTFPSFLHHQATRVGRNGSHPDGNSGSGLSLHQPQSQQGDLSSRNDPSPPLPTSPTQQLSSHASLPTPKHNTTMVTTTETMTTTTTTTTTTTSSSLSSSSSSSPSLQKKLPHQPLNSFRLRPPMNGRMLKQDMEQLQMMLTKVSLHSSPSGITAIPSETTTPSLTSTLTQPQTRLQHSLPSLSASSPSMHSNPSLNPTISSSSSTSSTHTQHLSYLAPFSIVKPRALSGTSLVYFIIDSNGVGWVYKPSIGEQFYPQRQQPPLPQQQQQQHASIYLTSTTPTSPPPSSLSPLQLSTSPLPSPPPTSTLPPASAPILIPDHISNATSESTSLHQPEMITFLSTPALTQANHSPPQPTLPTAALPTTQSDSHLVHAFTHAHPLSLSAGSPTTDPSKNTPQSQPQPLPRSSMSSPPTHIVPLPSGQSLDDDVKPITNTNQSLNEPHLGSNTFSSLVDGATAVAPIALPRTPPNSPLDTTMVHQRQDLVQQLQRPQLQQEFSADPVNFEPSETPGQIRCVEAKIAQHMANILERNLNMNMELYQAVSDQDTDSDCGGGGGGGGSSSNDGEQIIHRNVSQSMSITQQQHRYQHESNNNGNTSLSFPAYPPHSSNTMGMAFDTSKAAKPFPRATLVEVEGGESESGCFAAPTPLPPSNASSYSPSATLTTTPPLDHLHGSSLSCSDRQTTHNHRSFSIMLNPSGNASTTDTELSKEYNLHQEEDDSIRTQQQYYEQQQLQQDQEQQHYQLPAQHQQQPSSFSTPSLPLRTPSSQQTTHTSTPHLHHHHHRPRSPSPYQHTTNPPQTTPPPPPPHPGYPAHLGKYSLSPPPSPHHTCHHTTGNHGSPSPSAVTTGQPPSTPLVSRDPQYHAHQHHLQSTHTSPQSSYRYPSSAAGASGEYTPSSVVYAHGRAGTVGSSGGGGVLSKDNHHRERPRTPPLLGNHHHSRRVIEDGWVGHDPTDGVSYGSRDDHTSYGSYGEGDDDSHDSGSGGDDGDGGDHDDDDDEHYNITSDAYRSKPRSGSLHDLHHFHTHTHTRGRTYTVNREDSHHHHHHHNHHHHHLKYDDDDDVHGMAPLDAHGECYVSLSIDGDEDDGGSEHSVETISEDRCIYGWPEDEQGDKHGHTDDGQGHLYLSTRHSVGGRGGGGSTTTHPRLSPSSHDLDANERWRYDDGSQRNDDDTDHIDSTNHDKSQEGISVYDLLPHAPRLPVGVDTVSQHGYDDRNPNDDCRTRSKQRQPNPRNSPPHSIPNPHASHRHHRGYRNDSSHTGVPSRSHRLSISSVLSIASTPSTSTSTSTSKSISTTSHTQPGNSHHMPMPMNLNAGIVRVDIPSTSSVHPDHGLEDGDDGRHHTSGSGSGSRDVSGNTDTSSLASVPVPSRLTSATAHSSSLYSSSHYSSSIHSSSISTDMTSSPFFAGLSSNLYEVGNDAASSSSYAYSHVSDSKDVSDTTTTAHHHHQHHPPQHSYSSRHSTRHPAKYQPHHIAPHGGDSGGGGGGGGSTPTDTHHHNHHYSHKSTTHSMKPMRLPPPPVLAHPTTQLNDSTTQSMVVMAGFDPSYAHSHPRHHPRSASASTSTSSVHPAKTLLQQSRTHGNIHSGGSDSTGSHHDLPHSHYTMSLFNSTHATQSNNSFPSPSVSSSEQQQHYYHQNQSQHYYQYGTGVIAHGLPPPDAPPLQYNINTIDEESSGQGTDCDDCDGDGDGDGDGDSNGNDKYLPDTHHNTSSNTPPLSSSPQSQYDYNHTTTMTRMATTTTSITAPTPSSAPTYMATNTATTTGTTTTTTTTATTTTISTTNTQQHFQHQYAPSDNSPITLYDRIPIRQGVAYGFSATKELAAHLIDPMLVPETIGLITLTINPSTGQPQYIMGSLQRYAQSKGSVEDLSPSSICIESMHRVFILDIRILNLDRHTNNILAVSSGQEQQHQNPPEMLKYDGLDDDDDDYDIYSTDSLVSSLPNGLSYTPPSFMNYFHHICHHPQGSPQKDRDDHKSRSDQPSCCRKYLALPIDHSLSLPSIANLADVRFEWVDSKIAMTPMSDETRAFISSIPIVKDSISLFQVHIPIDSIFSNIISSLVLKYLTMTFKELTLNDIGKIFIREEVYSNNYDDDGNVCDVVVSTPNLSTFELAVKEAFRNTSIYYDHICKTRPQLSLTERAEIWLECCLECILYYIQSHFQSILSNRQQDDDK